MKKMKKHATMMVVTALVAFMSFNVWATKSRMQALGQNSLVGSFYIDDTRNVFHNPAEMHKHMDYVIIEWGDRTQQSLSGLVTGKETINPKPEGGFFKKMGNLSYGFYLGSEKRMDGPINLNYHPAVDSSNFAIDTSNSFDLFFSGDHFLQWGARIHYASNKAKRYDMDATHKASGVGLGIALRNLEAWMNYTLADEYEGKQLYSFSEEEQELLPSGWEKSKLENDGIMDMGLSYRMMNWTFFGNYDKYAVEIDKNNSYNKTILTVGAGYIHEISPMARVFMDISFRDEESTNVTYDELDNYTRTVEATLKSLPVKIAFEADATSWLVLRGSVSQPLSGNKKEKHKFSHSGETSETVDPVPSASVAAGATLNFGKLKLDGMIGIDDKSWMGKGSLNHENLLSRVALHYWF